MCKFFRPICTRSTDFVLTDNCSSLKKNVLLKPVRRVLRVGHKPQVWCAQEKWAALLFACVGICAGMCLHRTTWPQRAHSYTLVRPAEVSYRANLLRSCPCPAARKTRQPRWPNTTIALPTTRFIIHAALHHFAKYSWIKAIIVESNLRNRIESLETASATYKAIATYQTLLCACSPVPSEWEKVGLKVRLHLHLHPFKRPPMTHILCLINFDTRGMDYDRNSKANRSFKKAP